MDQIKIGTRFIIGNKEYEIAGEPGPGIVPCIEIRALNASPLYKVNNNYYSYFTRGDIMTAIGRAPGVTQITKEEFFKRIERAPLRTYEVEIHYHYDGDEGPVHTDDQGRTITYETHKARSPEEARIAALENLQEGLGSSGYDLEVISIKEV